MGTVVLAGGTGSAKLLRGLADEAGVFTVISNVGDNFWVHGLYVCPDVDIAMYTLAGVADTGKGWGVEGDTFRVQRQLERLGRETWFNLGDADIATHIVRTQMMREGMSLSEVTGLLCGRLGLRQTILPCTDDKLETHIVTPGGEMHLQEFWVKNRGEPEVTGVRYVGAEAARGAQGVLGSIRDAERIVFCPANPITSISPILAVREVREAIRTSRARRVAVSPMVGNTPVSGPSSKFMKALGLRPTSASVAAMYRELVDCMIMDESDSAMSGEVEGEGMECRLAPTLMRGHTDERRLARVVLEV